MSKFIEVSRAFALVGAMGLGACAMEAPEDGEALEREDDAVALSEQQIRATPNVGWVARHGLSSAQYQSAFDAYVSQGYRLTDVSVFSPSIFFGAPGVPSFAGIWEKSAGPAWVARHGLTGSAYQQTFDALSSQGYRPVLVEGYDTLEGARYAAIWERSSGPAWVARHGLTSEQYQAEFTRLVRAGYRLVHVSGYTDAGRERYAAIWDRSPAAGPWVARHGMSAAQYQAEFNQWVSQGYKLVLVDGYGVGGTDRYAAIWEKSPSAPWVARHGLTPAQYQATFDDLVRQGYRLVLVSGYAVGSAPRYAAVWRKP